MVQTRSLFNDMIDVIKQKKDLGIKVYEFQEIIIDNITFLYETKGLLSLPSYFLYDSLLKSISACFIFSLGMSLYL